MNIEEIILAFRLAKQQDFIGNVSKYANCISDDCKSCPADKACRYLANDKKGSYNYATFKQNFDILIRPNLRKYSMAHIKKHYPELFI